MKISAFDGTSCRPPQAHLGACGYGGPNAPTDKFLLATADDPASGTYLKGVALTSGLQAGLVSRSGS